MGFLQGGGQKEGRGVRKVDLALLREMLWRGQHRRGLKLRVSPGDLWSVRLPFPPESARIAVPHPGHPELEKWMALF